MSTSSSSSGGIGICGATFIVFLILKLLGIAPVATWSWWWVTAPLWIPAILVGVVLAVIVIIYILCNRKQVNG